MSHRRLTLMAVLAAVSVALLLAVVPVAGQAPPAATKTTAASKPSLRTPWGDPDLQGIWASNSATPLERPKILEGRPLLSPHELAVMKARAAELFDGDTDAAFGDSVFEAVLADAKDFKSRDTATGNYNHFWLVERWFDNRTSLITDPPDGRIPSLTPEGQKREAARAERRRQHPADGPEDRSLSERCITGTVPMTGRGYNSNYQLLQTPEYLVIHMEMMHDTRIIPLDRRPHLSQSIRGYMGDSRAHWEGNTLVVDTTNLDASRNFAGASANVHLVERFTRVDVDTLHYEFTANDPTTWTRPWTAMIVMRPAPGLIYEFACHEGNIGMVGILSGHRAQERAGEAAKKETTSK